MKYTGDCYIAIGTLFSEQPKQDWYPFLGGLGEYKAVLSTFPNILGNQKVSVSIFLPQLTSFSFMWYLNTPANVCRVL